MAKSGMDDEALAIQRAARELEKLDDASAQARVAFYLYLRYTAAGDRIAPGGVAPATPAALPVSAPQHAVSGPPAPAADDRAPAAPAPAAAPAGGRAPGTPALPPGAQAGLDLSGKGSENDDDASDMDRRPPPPPEPEPSFEGDDDDGVEVEI